MEQAVSSPAFISGPGVLFCCLSAAVLLLEPAALRLCLAGLGLLLEAVAASPLRTKLLSSQETGSKNET